MTRRLLWLTENFFPQRGGMAQSCDRIVSGLRRRGWSIDLAHLSSKWSEFQVLRRLGGVDLHVPVSADVSHTLNELWCHLPHHGSEDYDGVVAFGGHLPMIAAPVFAAWIGAPLVTLIRGNDFDAAVFDPKRSMVLERALTASSSVSAVSGDKVEKIKRLWPEVSVSWVANGIDLDTWTPIKSDHTRAETLRREWLGEEERLVLGFFGHIKRKKGGDYFTQALLRSGLSDRAYLLMVGDMEPTLERTLSAHPGLRYRHVPFADRYELIPYYLACDYVCIPSYYDGMPNVMLEAAALGIPLVASRAGGMADVLDERHGFMFDPGQINSCIAALKRAFACPALQREAMAEACHHLISTRLTVEIELTRYEEILSEIITP